MHEKLIRMYKKLSLQSGVLLCLVSSLLIALLIFGKSVEKSHANPTIPTFDTTEIPTPSPTETLTSPATSTTPSEPKLTNTATTLVLVTRVIDGDTIELESGEKVRYIGIDTPELHARNGSGAECYAGEAAERNVQLVFQKYVRLEKDTTNTDKYGRQLRYVYVDDTFINKQLVLEGFARAKKYPPDTRESQLLEQAMQSANENSLGLWGNCVAH